MAESSELPTLVVEGGPLDSLTMPLSPGSTVIIGSGRLAHMRVDHPQIELAHVKVAWDDVGLSMIDNGSRYGTWVNGEPVETAALLDGDVISFVAPGTKSPPPVVRVHIPAGVIAAPPPLPPTEEAKAHPAAETGPAEAARLAAARARAAVSRRRRRRIDIPFAELARLGLAVVAAALVLALGWQGWRWLFSAPVVSTIQPAQAEPGLTVTLIGRRFAGEAAGNVVWFGDRSVPAATVSGDALTATVPSLPGGGTVPVVVETAQGRSQPVNLVVLAPLAAASLEPEAALPGDEVALHGEGFADGAVEVTVAGRPASVIGAEAGSVRFQMPAIEGAPGSEHPVVATVAGRRTAALNVALGRAPLVLSVEPTRGVAGAVVQLRGVGLLSRRAPTTVTFDGVAALVAEASSKELKVVAPVPTRGEPEITAPFVVHSGAASSSSAPPFTLQRLVSGSFVLRFLAAAAGDGSSGQAFVATEIAPLLLLSFKDDARSPAERALRVAAALNEVGVRARVGGGTVRFEAREQPLIGVGVVGTSEFVVRTTPQDAAGYATPPGLPSRAAPPTAAALARYWAALLNDYQTLCSGGSRPSEVAALGPAAALDQLRSALPWQYGTGVANERVATLRPDLRQRLLELALRVP